MSSKEKDDAVGVRVGDVFETRDGKYSAKVIYTKSKSKDYPIVAELVAKGEKTNPSVLVATYTKDLYYHKSDRISDYDLKEIKREIKVGAVFDTVDGKYTARVLSVDSNVEGHPVVAELTEKNSNNFVLLSYKLDGTNRRMNKEYNLIMTAVKSKEDIVRERLAKGEDVKVVVRSTTNSAIYMYVADLLDDGRITVYPDGRTSWSVQSLVDYYKIIYSDWELV